MIGVPIKKKEHFGLGLAQRGECRVKTQTWREDGRGNQRQKLKRCCPMPRKAQGSQKLEEARRDPPSEALEGTCPADTLILDF